MAHQQLLATLLLVCLRDKLGFDTNNGDVASNSRYHENTSPDIEPFETLFEFLLLTFHFHNTFAKNETK